VRILCFADTRFPIERANGVQTMATCHALAARGHHVTLVARPDTTAPPRDPFEFYGFPRIATLEIEKIKKIPGKFLTRAQFLLTAQRRASASTVDVVFTRDLGVAAFLLQVPSARRRPLVYEAHGVASVVAEEMPRLLGKPELAPSAAKLRRLDRRETRVWRHAGAFVTITRALAEELVVRHGTREHVFVVPDGAIVPAVPVVPVVPDVPVAAYAGHLYPWKGVDVFLQALALAPSVRGLIVGGHPSDADFQRIKNQTHELGIADRVEMTGLVPPSDVRRHLARATILVLPNTRSAISERYTSPLKLFEYLAVGRPIVASDFPAIRELLVHDTHALLVPAGDASALAAALTRLASDAALSARLARAATALAPDYTWARRAERLEPALAAAVSAFA
jgi:glycosyltransferase involved in cell wall biosynthesis